MFPPSPLYGLNRRTVLIGGLAMVITPSHRLFAADGQTGIAAQAFVIGGAPGLKGYLVRPKAAGKYPAIIVMHDRQGLSPHIEAVTRRLAAAGYLALAVDCVSGNTHPNPSDLSLLSNVEIIAMMRAAVAAVRARPDYTGKIGALGFGWGGSAVNHLALMEPSLNVAVSYYGLQPLYYQEDDYRAFTAAMQQHYAGRDILTNEGIDNFRTSLTDVGKMPDAHVYANVSRGFDDETGTAYNAAAATLAWTRSIAFFKKHLG